MMNLSEFEEQFRALGAKPKTAKVDRLNRQLIKDGVDVSFLRQVVAEHQEYYRTYFAVSIAQRATLDEKFEFIESNFDLLGDWWHVDGITVYLGNCLDFDYAFAKAEKYVNSELEYVRRLGYVIFIPRLVRDKSNLSRLLTLFHNDDAYHVVMGEAWLLSYIAMCDCDTALNFIKACDLKYNIIGKAIQKICDSFVISDDDKQRFKALRAERKLYQS